MPFSPAPGSICDVVCFCVCTLSCSILTIYLFLLCVLCEIVPNTAFAEPVPFLLCIDRYPDRRLLCISKQVSQKNAPILECW